MTTQLPLPPKPTFSTLRQTLRFGRDPVALITECMENLGDVFSLKLLGLGTWVFICSPQGAKQLFKAPRETLHAGDIHRKFVGYLFGNESTFTLDGDKHRDRQRLVMPLLNGSAVDQYVQMIREVSQETFGEQRGHGESPLLTLNHRLSLRLLVRCILGSADVQGNRWFTESFEDYTDRGTRSAISQIPFFRFDLGPWSPWGKVIRLRRALRDRLQTEIQARRAALGKASDREARAHEPVAILDELVAAAEESGSALDDQGIIDEAMTLLFAGHETTGTVLTWVLAMLLKHPDVRHKVLDEISEVVGSGTVEACHLKDLRYLQAVIDESIRINPIGPFSAFRRVVRPWQIEGERGTYRIPEGQVIAHSFPVMSLREDLFPDPIAFRPERFLETDMESYSWSPFGGGGRVCSGRGLAIVELKVAVATILREFELRTSLQDFRRVRMGQFLAPEKGLPVEIT